MATYPAMIFKREANEDEPSLPIVRVGNVSRDFQVDRGNPNLSGRLLTRSWKTYQEPKVVIDRISFEIQAGESVAFIGPNGAGKSTMIKMLVGILMPTSGTIEVLGRSPFKERKRNAKEIGVVFGQRSSLWLDLPLRSSFELHKAIYNISTSKYESILAELLQTFQISALIERLSRHLSLGERMRAELCLAMLHEPKILFLDEPTIGLDIDGKAIVRNQLRELARSRGTTIFLTSHDLADVETICERLFIIDEGRLLFDGSITDLSKCLGLPRKLHLEFKEDPGAITLPHGKLVQDSGTVKIFEIDGENYVVGDILAALSTLNGLNDLSFKDPIAEDLVRRFYKAGSKLT
ncbi:ATP-binding cassette domain-containing protein [Agrobacterium tumefaciens]|uniref:ABC transporter ATP-binding protein n=1 Tax=Agrobacterium tumefaciens TaxID=358 RepID=UPI0012B714C4|nr:ATP-binding cassette domain-containing protein [Agrobacterium tumefaciens]MQB08169.1 ATP-binding cassette domain-containing protein [Agrobacterium tumefaciens]